MIYKHINLPGKYHNQTKANIINTCYEFAESYNDKHKTTFISMKTQKIFWGENNDTLFTTKSVLVKSSVTRIGVVY